MLEDLPTLVDRLMKHQATAGPRRTAPVLVLEGTGGSGRTTALRKAFEEWRKRTPSVLVQPWQDAGPPDTAVRRVLAAVMLGLSPGIPGYAMKFPRSVVAQIALNEDFSDLTPDQARDRLRAVLNAHRSRVILFKFITDLAISVGKLAPTVATSAVGAVAEAVVSQLQQRRVLVQFTWGSAVPWFGHQDKGFGFDAEQTLIELSNHARAPKGGAAKGVDDLLVAALLADLRHSRDRVRGNPPNALVLLDDGDLSAAMAFTGSLVRVRATLAVAPGALPDPLNLVVSTAGPLAEALDRQAPGGRCTPGRRIDWDRPWLRIPAADLSRPEVHHLAEQTGWADADRRALITHRLTRGHPETTVAVLTRLGHGDGQADDLDGLLRHQCDGGPLERVLLHPFVRGLSPHRFVDQTLLEALVTLSAARHRLEAERLAPLLPGTVRLSSDVFTSPTLWTPPGPADRQRLHPLVRYLGIRALAARTDPADDWTAVFRALRDEVAPGDHAGRLHHERLLSGKEAVADELAALLPELPSAEWLDMLGEVTATCDPRESDLAAVRGPLRPSTPTEHIVVLLGVLPALEHEACLTEELATVTLRALAEDSLLHLAGSAQDRAPFILRAQRYDKYTYRFW